MSSGRAGKARDGRTGELVRGKGSSHIQLSAHEMAGLLRHWLLDKGHLKVIFAGQKKLFCPSWLYVIYPCITEIFSENLL